MLENEPDPTKTLPPLSSTGANLELAIIEAGNAKVIPPPTINV